MHEKNSYLCSMKAIEIDDFIALAEDYLVLDVRSPSEYEHAHIPGAISLPLFDDEERKVVGTTYKKQSREAAIKIGLDYFGPKMREMVNTVEKRLHERDSKTVLVHCWRGGMRSAAIAWLLDLYGFKVFTLKGGYKSFRNWVLQQFEAPHNLRILSGFTGSGKTEILHALAERNEPILDLEGIAGHRGSAFGALGLPPQPGIQHFENMLAMKLYKLTQMYGDKPIWVESESNRIGQVNINYLFFNQMKAAERVHIEVSLEERVKKVVEEYGNFDKEKLKAAVKRIQKRLGGLQTKNTLKYLDEGDIASAFEILISYYDKYYRKSTLFQEPIAEIELPNTDAAANADILIEKMKELHVGETY